MLTHSCIALISSSLPRSLTQIDYCQDFPNECNKTKMCAYLYIPVELYILKSCGILHQRLFNLEFPRNWHLYKNRWNALIVYTFN